MNQSSEKYIERHLCKEIENLGGLCIKLISTITGLPDRMCLLPKGRILFVELKSTGKKQSARQKYMQSKLEALGFEVFVLDSVIKINELIDYINGSS